jgi:hypothetical protein
MAEKLLKFYQAMQDRAGLSGRTKLAMETKIPSTKAALAPDSEENLRRFREAFTRITGQAPPDV